MNDPAKNILIGLFVFAASGIVIFVLLFLHPVVGDDAQKVRVRFANIDKVTLGTRVSYGGKPVGEVLEIHDIEAPQDGRKEGRDGYIYLYELVLGLDSKVHIYNTDEISARTSGLLGEKSVEITPMPVKPGEKAYIVQDQVIYANESGSVEETLKEFKDLSGKIDSTLDSVKSAIDELNKDKFWDKLNTIAKNISDITTALNDPQKLTAIMDNVEKFTENINKTLENVDKAVANVIDFTGNIKTVTGTIKEGKGTVGSIVMKDDIYLQTTSLLSKAETLLDDVNHYGILFQNDKRWQRLRARRANLVTRLTNPQEFRNYFNDELNEITTSLSRLSWVLQETESCDCYGAYMDDGEFRKVFAELMRRVNTMEESLKMYNQQVVERDVLKTELCSERQ